MQYNAFYCKNGPSFAKKRSLGTKQQKVNIKYPLLARGGKKVIGVNQRYSRLEDLTCNVSTLVTHRC